MLLSLLPFYPLVSFLLIIFLKKQLSWLNGADTEGKGNLKEALILSETPTVLLLDSQNQIIMKRFKPEELRLFLKGVMN